MSHSRTLRACIALALLCILLTASVTPTLAVRDKTRKGKPKFRGHNAAHMYTAKEETEAHGDLNFALSHVVGMNPNSKTELFVYTINMKAKKLVHTRVYTYDDDSLHEAAQTHDDLHVCFDRRHRYFVVTDTESMIVLHPTLDLIYGRHPMRHAHQHREEHGDRAVSSIVSIIYDSFRKKVLTITDTLEDTDTLELYTTNPSTGTWKFYAHIPHAAALSARHGVQAIDEQADIFYAMKEDGVEKMVTYNYYTDELRYKVTMNPVIHDAPVENLDLVHILSLDYIKHREKLVAIVTAKQNSHEAMDVGHLRKGEHCYLVEIDQNTGQSTFILDFGEYTDHSRYQPVTGVTYVDHDWHMSAWLQEGNDDVHSVLHLIIVDAHSGEYISDTQVEVPYEFEPRGLALVFPDDGAF